MVKRLHTRRSGHRGFTITPLMKSWNSFLSCLFFKVKAIKMTMIFFLSRILSIQLITLTTISMKIGMNTPRSRGGRNPYNQSPTHRLPKWSNNTNTQKRIRFTVIRPLCESVCPNFLDPSLQVFRPPFALISLSMRK